MGSLVGPGPKSRRGKNNTQNTTDVSTSGSDSDSENLVLNERIVRVCIVSNRVLFLPSAVSGVSDSTLRSSKKPTENYRIECRDISKCFGLGSHIAL